MAFPKTTVYITGTSRGIGKALAERLLKEENVLRLTGISRQHTIGHERYQGISCDLSDAVQLQQFNPFDPSEKPEQAILINNAGMVGPVGAVGTLADEEIMRAFTLNVTAPAVLTNRFLKAYGDHKNVKLLVINISSGAGKYPVKGWGVYCASKAALDAFSQVAGEELPENVKVFSVAPGVVDTAMQDEIRQSDPEQFPRVEEFKKMKSGGALNSPEAVADKFMELLALPQKFTEVLQDVRRF